MSDNTLSMTPEIAVLSLILNNPDLIYSTGGLKPHMFSASTHQNIFSVMQEIGQRNLLPDASMVVQHIVATGKLDSCGGEKYIAYLRDSSFTRDNFPESVRLVKNSFKVSAVASLANSLKIGSLRVDDIDNQISSIQDNLDKLLDSSSGDGTFSIGSLVKDSFNEIVERVNNPGIRGSHTGIKKIDSLTGGFDGGDLWYIGARPGQGKTALMCSSAIRLGKSGTPCLLFSKEMTRQPIIERFLSMYTGIPFFDIRMGLLDKNKVEQIFQAAKEISEYPIYIDLNFTGSIEQIESTIRKYNSLYGTKVIYIDYIQLLSERSADQTQELGRISRKLKLLANSLDTTHIVLSQLNREVEHRDNKRPVMADLRQCGNLEEDADFIIGLYRDDYYNKDSREKGKMEFIILKHRNGPTGTIMLGFDGSTAQVKED